MSTASTLTSRDYLKLRSAAILAVILFATGIALVYWEFKETAAARIALRQADARHQDADRKLQRVSQEEVEIKAKSALFRQLETRRIVGPELRLNWVEAINAIRDRRKLFGIDYEITPQQPLGAPAGPYQFTSSAMNFSLPLLHETDLTGFLGDLRREAPAVVHVERCKIERARPDTDAKGVAALLAAQCSLRWITLYDTRGATGK